jgi:hypothetical protein
MNKPLISFLGEQSVKDAKILDINKHMELDALDQGKYWNAEKKTRLCSNVHHVYAGGFRNG